LRQHRPDDAVIGEEGTDSEGSTGVRWLVDPIDGTVNFLYGLPAYSVSIAAAIGTQTVAGVVYNPISDELFTASLGSGAHLNGSAISVTKRPDPSKALVATGFSYRSDRRRIQAQLLTAVLPRIGDLRRLGSAALDLCAVAAGRVDAFYEEGLNVWDYAAGKLLVEEAGGRCDIRDDLVPGAETLIAGSPIMVDTLADLLAKAASQADRG
ncbi:MAG: inositol monophosphatase, partial [Acidimicrobiia bacterium]|nr:inositol monophosphatase [Acidimicrobiia bacterium]